jgi:hypothetical protein
MEVNCAHIFLLLSVGSSCRLLIRRRGLIRLRHGTFLNPVGLLLLLLVLAVGWLSTWG